MSTVSASNLDKNNGMDPQLEKLMQESIVKVLLEDPKTMPLNVLRTKTYKEVKGLMNNIFIRDEDFLSVIDKMKVEYLIGQNKYNKFYIDYLDYSHSEVTGEGFLEIDAHRGNGFITIKKHANEYKKSSHFVHRKNLNGAKNGDYVKYVELIVNNRKHFDKFALIDAAILAVLEKPVAE